MPELPPPDDRAAMQALQQLKAYNAYKGRQMQSHSGGPDPVDQDIKTVETWAADAGDSGSDWGRDREKKANDDIAEEAAWNQKIAADEKQAAGEADLRAQLDVGKLKDEMKKTLDQHAAAYQALADAGDPDFKKKLGEVRQQTAQAKDFVDKKMEKAIEDKFKRAEDARAKRKQFADQAGERGAEGRKWKAEFGGKPEAFAAGQKADVKKALAGLASAASARAGQLEAAGPKAAPHVAELKKVEAWAKGLAPKVDGQGPALGAAKAEGKAGAAHARATFSAVENFEVTLENDGSDALEVFRRWTDNNNKWAKQWISSGTPKQKQWAEAWLKTQQ